MGLANRENELVQPDQGASEAGHGSRGGGGLPPATNTMRLSNRMPWGFRRLRPELESSFKPSYPPAPEAAICLSPVSCSQKNLTEISDSVNAPALSLSNS